MLLDRSPRRAPEEFFNTIRALSCHSKLDRRH